jgi:hypothetical protein
MDWKSFSIGLGVALSVGFIALPEMLGYGNQEPKPASRSLPAPPAEQPPRVSDEEDRIISARKIYHPPDRRKWIAQNAVGCPPNIWIPCPPIYFERPDGPPPDFEAEDEPEPPPQRDRPIVAMHKGMKGPYGGPR